MIFKPLSYKFVQIFIHLFNICCIYLWGFWDLGIFFPFYIIASIAAPDFKQKEIESMQYKMRPR